MMGPSAQGPSGAFPEAVPTLGLFPHYFYPCKYTSQIPANTLGFVMLFNNLSHLNEIFILRSLSEQSPRFPEMSLSFVFEDSPTGRGSSLSEAWGPPAEAEELWEYSSMGGRAGGHWSRDPLRDAGSPKLNGQGQGISVGMPSIRPRLRGTERPSPGA